jgi:WW domain-containing oxidoreductase
LQYNAAKIYLLSQKEEHADEATEELKKYGDPSRVEWVRCDLKSLKQTDEAAKQLASLQQIDAVSLPGVLGWEV